MEKNKPIRSILEQKILDKNKHSQAKALHDAFSPGNIYIKEVERTAGKVAAKELLLKITNVILNTDFSFNEIFYHIDLPIDLQNVIISEEIDKILTQK